jgi:integrase/recombinase XerD
MVKFIPAADAARMVAWDLSNLHALRKKGRLSWNPIPHGKNTKWEVDIEEEGFVALLAAKNLDVPKGEESVSVSACPIDWQEWTRITRNGLRTVCKPLTEPSQKEYRYHIMRFYKNYAVFTVENAGKSLADYGDRETERCDLYPTKLKHFISLKHLAKWLIYKKMIHASTLTELALFNPFKKGETEPKRAVHTAEVIHQVIKSLTTATNKLGQPIYNEQRATINEALVAVMSNTGARRGEVSNIRMQDIDLRTGDLLLYGKRRKERTVTLPPSVLALVKRCLRYRNTACIYLFQNEDGEKLSPDSVYRKTKRAGKNSSVTDFAPHSLRRSFTRSAVINNDIPFTTVRDMLGHTDIRMTSIYSRTTDEDVKKASKNFILK